MRPGGERMFNKIKALRALHNLTQDQVAKELRCDHSKISRIERGYIQPKLEEKQKIAELLKVSPEEIFEE